MIDSPPGGMRRGPYRYSPGRAIAAEDQPAIHCGRGRRTTAEFTIGVGDDQRRTQERAEILSYVSRSFLRRMLSSPALTAPAMSVSRRSPTNNGWCALSRSTVSSNRGR